MYVAEAQTDFISNALTGDGSPMGAHLAGMRYDENLMRRYFDDEHRECIRVNTHRKNKDGKPIFHKMTVNEAVARGIPVVNAPTSLRKDEWISLDRAVIEVQREQLRVWDDLASANTFGGFDGMSKLILEHETMSDSHEAFTDFDALTEGRSDSPVFQLEGLPLPITHSDFFYSARRLAVSRNTGTPLDTTGVKHATRKVLERIERMTIGTLTGPTYGTTADYGRAPTVYGYTNFPARITYTSLTTPTGSNPEATVANVLTLLDLAEAKHFQGPFMLYTSTDWDRFLDNDYARLGGNNANMTLRDRLRKIDRIRDVRRLGYLAASSNPFTMILVQMTENVARAVVGMPIRVVQWETMGGMRLNYKVMCIMVPQLRADYDGNCGIIHATTS